MNSKRPRKIISIYRSSMPFTYTEYNEPLEQFYDDWSAWEGDDWLAELWRTRPYSYLGQMPEHQRLVAAAVETFPGSDYSLHLIPAGQGLPRPQENLWLIYAPGRASESLVYPSEQQARWALYALVAHEALAEMPFDGRDAAGEYLPPEEVGISALTHVDLDGRLIGFGAITSYLPGNQVVFGLMNGEPFAVNLDNQTDDSLARRILAERLGGTMPMDLQARRAEIESRHSALESDDG
ncbi:hypothetical protein ACFV1N_46935 [Streptosporangium canum]|uniref:hypothetical protein n=1 Tax=Streptosporangium canum TaxID=324952 RepID=UPI00368F0F1A